MNGQTMIVAAIVSVAAFAVGRRAWRAWRSARTPASGCGSDCGCGKH